MSCWPESNAREEEPEPSVVKSLLPVTATELQKLQSKFSDAEAESKEKIIKTKGEYLEVFKPLGSAHHSTTMALI